MRALRVVVVSWFALAMAACGGDDDVVIDAAPIDAHLVDAPPNDGATDAPAIDAPIDADPNIACDPLGAPGAQGCAAGQKCTWIEVQETPDPLGKLGCVPDGTVAVGGACVQGPVGETTGFDNCLAGGICIAGACSDICGFDGSANAACASGSSCTRYNGVFANGADDPVAGACNPECNPITQLQGNGTACPAGQGCYLLTTQTTTSAVCAGAGTIQHGTAITGQAFANSCVPGAQPRRRDTASSVVECGGLCAPAEVTSTTNMTSEGGVGNNSCTARWGANPPSDGLAGESCRYWWAREPFDALSPYSNTVGWCFKHTNFQYDTNGDTTPDAPFPRCINLTTGDVVPPIGNPPHNDAQYFWCVTLPVMFTGSSPHVPRTPEPLADRLVR